MAAVEAPPDVESEIRACSCMCLTRTYEIDDGKEKKDVKFYHCVYRDVDFEVLCFMLLKKQYKVLLGNHSAVKDVEKTFMLSGQWIKSLDEPYFDDLADIARGYNCVYVNRGESTVQVICSALTYTTLCGRLFRDDIDVVPVD